MPDASLVISICRGHALIIQIMRSGRIEWMQRDGGRRLGSVDPERVATFIEQLRSRELPGGKWVGQRYTGPDAEATGILVRDGDENIVDVASWHDNFEEDSRLVATATGIVPLDGRTRDEVLAGQPQAYREFRQRWDRVMGLIRELVPPEPHG
ncbi:MAG: hypothetical protein ABI759_28615 [Candidatus Solibacter sp.]